MILMLSETDLQAQKNGSLKQAYILLVQPHPPDGKTHIRIQKKTKTQNICSTQNVQPMFMTENNNPLHSQTHNMDPPFLYNSKP